MLGMASFRGNGMNAVSVHGLVSLRSVDELRAQSDAWDDLWRRCDVALPTVRALPLAQWFDHFAAGRRIHAVVVEREGRWIAALPLVEGRLARFARVGKMTSDPWWTSGELLVDRACDYLAYDSLVQGLSRTPWSLLWLDWARYDTDRWRRFLSAARAHGMRVDTAEHFHVGRIEIDHDWEGYKSRWTRNHRRALRRAERAVGDRGWAVDVHVFEPTDDIDALMRQAFEIEDRSWKGEGGTSVLRQPSLFEFYCRQTRALAEQGHAVLSRLWLEQRLIAFEYGWLAKGTYFSFKVSFDPEFSDLAPGQQLRRSIIEHWFGDRDMRTVDFCGPLSRATAPFSTEEALVGRVALSRPTIAGRGLSMGIAAARALKSRLRSAAPASDDAAEHAPLPRVRPKSESANEGMERIAKDR